VVAMVATASLMVAACGNSSGGGAGGSKVDHVTIGIIEDFSGAQSPLGVADAAGIQQAADEINKAGGIKSLGGAKIVIKKYDTETNPDNGVTQATKAVADKVNVVIGGEISDTVIAGTNVTHRAGIPWITTGGTAAQITKRGFNDVFQAVTNTDQSAQNYYNVMKYFSDKLGLGANPTMGMSVSDTTYGNNLDAGFSKVNSGFFNVVTKVSYPLTTTDLSSIAARMVSKSPQVLYNEGYPTDGLNFGKLFQDKFRTSAKIFLSTGTYSVILKELGAKANGMLLSAGPSDLFKGMPAKYSSVNETYKAANGGADIPSSAVTGYVEMMITAQALEKAASTKGADIAKALHEVKLTHDQGNLYPQELFGFNSTGALDEAPVFFIQVQDGKAVGVFPEAQASGTPQPFR
jgi:branched-chain amino acid transport system substrate-binding protein